MKIACCIGAIILTATGLLANENDSIPQDSIPVDTIITFQDGTTSRVQTSLRVVELEDKSDKDVA